MTLHTPAASRPLWIAALLFGLAVFPLALYSSDLYYAEGGTSPDGPGMLLVALVYTAPVWLTGWMLVAAVYLVRYPGRVPVLVGPGDGIVAFVLSILVCAG